MPLDFTPLETELTELTTTVQGVVALLADLAQRVRDTAGDPAKVTELANALDSQKEVLAAAVAAHTPGEPPPPIEPPARRR